MTKQPKALRLADELLDGFLFSSDDVVAELRRLHEVNAELLKTMRQLACLGNGNSYGNSDGNVIAQAAIAKATGEQA